MLTVNATFTAEERDMVRTITQETLIAWKKTLKSNIVFFTIGTSTIAGPDIIGGSLVAPTFFDKFQYDDESAYVTELSFERQFEEPTGSVFRAMADINLDNTSGRFTRGVDPEIGTALLPRRPVRFAAGFTIGGTNRMVAQFFGLTDTTPLVDDRQRTAQLHAIDWIDYLDQQPVNQSGIFTSVMSDVVIADMLGKAGFNSNQYSLDPGINRLNVVEYENDDKFGYILRQIAEAELGKIYQDEDGIIRFENRQHWTQAPHNAVQRIISTAQVINSQMPSDDHIINVVEVKSSPRSKQPDQLIWQNVDTIVVPGTGTVTVPISFDDPVLAVDTPSAYVAYDRDDPLNGTDVTANVSVDKIYTFPRSAIITFRNVGATPAYITGLTIYGRPARQTHDLYYREQDSSSVTAYQEKVYTIQNDYIQDDIWAQSLAGIILNDFSNPERLADITIRAIPELQLGDLVSWQGRYWFIYGIRTVISQVSGYTQELNLLQRSITTYFRIGYSSIEGSDKISP